MRLINTETLQLEEFMGNDIPIYQILSHRWSNDEVSYKDYIKGRNTGSKGYHKVVDFCQFVQRNTTGDDTSNDYEEHEDHSDQESDLESDRERDSESGRYSVAGSNDSDGLSALDGIKPSRGPSYVWVDTCCIDKRSSAELSEAINSMWAWYRGSETCFVYLSDVHYDTRRDMQHNITDLGSKLPVDEELVRRLESSEWFTRGWTLQELLAPERVVFIDDEWRVLGQIHSPTSYQDYGILSAAQLGPWLDTHVSRITGIDQRYLCAPDEYRSASIARRISWAAHRTTTRPEDIAYCLLGLLEVHMPLLYGEGRMAFRRLQEEVMRRNNDHSILAWPSRAEWIPETTGILATSPSDFASCGSIEQMPIDLSLSYAITNQGLELRSYIRRVKVRDDRVFNREVDMIRVSLNCRRARTREPLALYLVGKQGQTHERGLSKISLSRTAIITDVTDQQDASILFTLHVKVDEEPQSLAPEFSAGITYGFSQLPPEDLNYESERDICSASDISYESESESISSVWAASEVKWDEKLTEEIP